MEQILRSYRRRLINLSGNNQAILLRRLRAGLQLDLQAFDFVSAQPAFELLRAMIAGKKSVPLAPFADPRQADVAPLSRKLREISRRAALLQEERGSPELFIGWPFVNGKLNDGTVLRCPLLFFPVKLTLDQKQQWVLNRDPLAAPVLNQSFLLAYAHYNQLAPDEQLLQTDFSEFPQDALSFRTKLYELLKGSSLEINFNQQLFEDKLQPFRAFTKTDLEAQFQAGELKLFPEAVLGIFPQAGSYLMADYDALLQQPDALSWNKLFKTELEPLSPAGNLEQHTFAVFDLDAQQERVLQEVKSGRSVVVQGPPGTGKSQLICNLVTDFMARGKTVWVVCQKRAALDVVYKRLASKGFENFTALVHDFEADRRMVFNKLKLQIEEVEAYKKQNNQLPVVFAERRFLEISRRINQLLQTLNAFKAALFDHSVCGWSAKELYLRSSLKQTSLELPGYRVFTAGTLPFFLPELEQYLAGAAMFDAPEFALAQRKNLAGWNWPEQKKMEQFARKIPERVQFFFETLPAALQQKNTPVHAWELLQNEAEKLEALEPLLASAGGFWEFPGSLFSLTSAQLKKLAKMLEQLELSFAAESVFLTESEWQTASDLLTAYEKSRENLWRKTKWQLQNRPKKALLQVLEKFQLPFSETGTAALKNRLALLQARQELMQELYHYIGDDFPEISPDAPGKNPHLERLKKVLQAVQLAKKLQRKKILTAESQTVGLQARKLLEGLRTLEAEAKEWQQLLTGTQIKKLAEDAPFRQKFLEDLAQHFDDLVKHDSRFSAFSTIERTVAEMLKDLPGSVPEKLVIFQNSVFLNWLLALETQNPVLKLAGPEIEKLEKELQELVLQKQSLSHEIVLTRLREKTYASLEKNRLGNVVSYRKLYAQVSKKRNLFSLRKLQANFSAEIQDLVPCWLASPETVSAVFPVTQQPDLIIFDEASQAFAETGLPAIFRAKQVVIAGDEHQLAPTDLYSSRWQDEDEETEEIFVESLLQLGSLHLPQHWLTSHYRSRFPELIRFSNQHFYRNKLQLIPERKDLENAAPAISFLKVNGLWEAQQNRPEAEKVVALVFQLLAEGEQDIGIITFNFAQQNLILDLVEMESAAREMQVPASVLIKNIENVQGDEKQIVILAIGYAADAGGRMVSQFGSLSRAKGENRLNVAITRAISKLFVVSSITAVDLNVANSRHAGPQLLQEFLRYAQEVAAGNFEWIAAGETRAHAGFYLKERLRQVVKTVGNWSEKLPFADLALCKDKRYCQLIRTDDELYFNQLSPRESHFDVPFRLQQRNWPYRTFFSRQYWQHPEKLLHEIENISC